MGEMSYNIVYLLTNIFCLYVYYRFMCVFFYELSVGKKTAIIAYTFEYFLTSVLYLCAPYPWLNILSSIIGIFCITLCYKSNLRKRIIVTILIFSLLFVAEGIVALIIGLSNFSFFEKTHYGSNLTLIIVEIFFWIMTLVVGKFKNIKREIPVPKMFVIAIVIIPVTTVFLEIIVFQHKDVDDSLAIVSLLCVLVANFITIYLYDSLSKIFVEQTQNEIVRREKAYYHNQTELLQKSYEETKRFRHDVKNHLYVLEQIIEQGDVKKAEKYLIQFVDKLDSTKIYSTTGNVAFDSVINYKLSKAERNGVKIYSKIAVPSDICIRDEDVVTIFGNLLDNAIEANEKISENKFIKLYVEYDKGCIFIEVKNSFDGNVKLKNRIIQTSKNDKKIHGIGLKSVEESINNYQGNIELEYDKNEFKVNIILYVN